jgi:hypothetical protein
MKKKEPTPNRYRDSAQKRWDDPKQRELASARMKQVYARSQRAGKAKKDQAK